LQGTLRFVHATARRHLDSKLRGQKQYFDRRVNRREFSVGDQVLWLRPHRTKLQNVWQGPYLVVEKAVEWNHYTVEREGKRRKVAACQLKRFHSDEAGADIRFATLQEPREPVSGFSPEDSNELVIPETPLTDYSGPVAIPYEEATFPLEEDTQTNELELPPRVRQPPVRYPRPEWVRRMANVGPTQPQYG
jgi:hypothetical protein